MESDCNMKETDNKAPKGPDKDKNNGKKKLPVAAWFAIGFAVLALINIFLLPNAFSSSNEEEVTYDVFLQALEAGRIDKVELKSSAAYYTLKAEAEATAEEKSEDKAAETAESDGQVSSIGLFGYKGVSVPEVTLSATTEKTASASKVYFTYLVGDENLVDRLVKAGVTFCTVTEKQSLLLSILLQYGIPIVIYMLLFSFLMRRLGRVGAGGGLLNMGKSNARSIEGKEIKTSFKDVAGQDEAKESLVEIVSYLHDPKKYAEVGAKMPRGALLIGPPGTGKTLLARAVAGEASVPFLSISGPEFVELFVGLGASKVRDLFKEAREKAPCIVFIDEIDAIGKKRDNSGFGGNDEREQTLNQLLSEMDGFEENSGVMVLAATNRPDSLDKALLRPGRFDRRVPVELPDQAGREAILKIHGAKIKTEGTINYSAVARITPGASGADLANVINESALCAVRNGRRAVTQKDLEDSVDVALAGKQRKSMVISPKEKEIIAYHEVGHAIATACQKGAAPVHKITIIPRTSGALGFTMQADEGEHFLLDKEEAFAKLVTLCGGRAAESIVFGTVTTGASNDIEECTRLARAMITRYGMNDALGFVAFEHVNNAYLSGDTSLTCSNDTAALIDREVMALIEKAYSRAMELLQQNMARLNLIAGKLMEKETILGDEFEQLMRETEPELSAPEEAQAKPAQSEEPAVLEADAAGSGKPGIAAEAADTEK